MSVNLLGGFAAAVDGVPVAESAWRLKKSRELVKLLARGEHSTPRRSRSATTSSCFRLTSTLTAGRMPLPMLVTSGRPVPTALHCLSTGCDLLPEKRYDDWATERREELAGLAAELAEELSVLSPDGADRMRPLPAEAASAV